MLFADELESLAGNCFIEGREINNFMNDESFEIINSDGNTIKIEIDEDAYVAFEHYYSVWNNFNQFKILPHGKGTMHEHNWVIDIIKYFNYVNSEVELHMQQQRR